MERFQAFAVLLIGPVLALCPVGSAMADFLLKNHLHTETVTNNTGKAANDLHVELIHPATGAAPTAPPFAPGATGGDTIDFSGGTVGAGGSATVSWQSKFASDKLDPANPGNWTFNKADIGAVATAALNLLPGYVDLGGGTVIVLIENTGAPVFYSDLDLVTGADVAFFTPSDYIAGMATGSHAGVTLLVPTSGILGSGITQIALMEPSLSSDLYSAGMVNIEGELFAHGAQVPEPGSLALLLLGLLPLALSRLRS